MMKPEDKSQEDLPDEEVISNTDEKHNPGLLAGMAGGTVVGGVLGSALGPLGAVTGAAIGSAAGAIAGLAIAKNVDPAEDPDLKKSDPAGPEPLPPSEE
jgi:outer membrane lipoprotein SlyB